MHRQSLDVLLRSAGRLLPDVFAALVIDATVAVTVLVVFVFFQAAESDEWTRRRTMIRVQSDADDAFGGISAARASACGTCAIDFCIPPLCNAFADVELALHLLWLVVEGADDAVRQVIERVSLVPTCVARLVIRDPLLALGPFDLAAAIIYSWRAAC